jgi:hypothetical protein
MRKLRQEMLPPFLLTLYFILFYYSYNLFKVVATDLPAVIIVCLIVTGIGLAISYLILRSFQRAVFVTSLLVILFFAFGHIHNLFQSSRFLPLYRPHYLAVVWALLMLGGLIFALQRPRYLQPINRFMGIMSAILVALSVSSVVYNALTYHTPDMTLFIPQFEVQAAEPRRDIYYIILDEYVGNSTLLDKLGYDNCQFANSLRDRGFYFAENAHSNYFKTILSLPSSLNMMYLDFLNGSGADIPTPGVWLVQNNIIMQTLKKLGYTYVHFGSGNIVTLSSPNADVVYEAAGQALFFNRIPLFTVTGFNWGLADTTALRPFLRSNDFAVRTRYYLEKLPEIPKMPEPTFTFVHLMIPHTPWTFTADDGPENPNGRMVDGEIVDEDKYAFKSAYIDQIMFTNRVISQLVDTLLAESDIEPIILIQGDHGLRELCHNCWAERANWDDQFYADVVLPIFSAYYLPDGGDAQLYPTISPVNSFRVVFNHYFGANLELLDDIHFRPVDYETRANEFIDITSVVNASVAAAHAGCI